MHRRAKAYPAGDNDEYWYAGDQLIEDQGNLAQVYSGGETHYHPIDDYVWLGGRPVVIIHGSLDASDVRMADDGANCSRERDGSVCGKYFPVTDHIGKPVLMLDGNQKVSGVGEYDPYGQLNRVSLDAETDHSYTVSDATIADFTQPSVGGTTEDMRVKLQMVDLRSGNWSAHCGGTAYQDSAQLFDPNSSSNLGSAITGAHTGGVWSDWVTPTADEVQVNLATECAELQTSGTCSCSTSKTKTGLVMEGYEYRRYQSGANPFWTPLRFPGQYHDDETDLNQNWNRYYQPLDDRYLEPEPKLSSWNDSMAASLSAEFPVQVVYQYARANTVAFVDPSGLNIPKDTPHYPIPFPPPSGPIRHPPVPGPGTGPRNPPPQPACASSIAGAVQDAAAEQCRESAKAANSPCSLGPVWNSDCTDFDCAVAPPGKTFLCPFGCTK